MPDDDNNEKPNSQNGESDQDDQNLENAGDDDAGDGEDGAGAGDGAGDDGAAGDDDDADALREKNKQLFARAKKAEGFVLKDGQWVKKTKPAPAKPAAPAKPEGGDQEQPTDVNTAVQAALDKRDLDAMEISDNVKSEIKKYAKLNKVTIQEAAKSDYISFLKKQESDKAAADDAAAGGGPRKTQPITNFTEDTKPEDFDLTTEEGRKSWESYKAWLKTK